MSARRDGMGPDGAALIAAERERHKAKWDAAHDDAEHSTGGLAKAAACMAQGWAPVSAPLWVDELLAKTREDPLRRLVVAGALVAAEIDRLKRGGVR